MHNVDGSMANLSWGKWSWETKSVLETMAHYTTLLGNYGWLKKNTLFLTAKCFFRLDTQHTLLGCSLLLLPVRVRTRKVPVLFNDQWYDMIEGIMRILHNIYVLWQIRGKSLVLSTHPRGNNDGIIKMQSYSFKSTRIHWSWRTSSIQ